MNDAAQDDCPSEKRVVITDIVEPLFIDATTPTAICLIVACKEHGFDAKAVINIESNSFVTNKEVLGLYLGMAIRRLKQEAKRLGCDHFEQMESGEHQLEA